MNYFKNSLIYYKWVVLTVPLTKSLTKVSSKSSMITIISTRRGKMINWHKTPEKGLKANSGSQLRMLKISVNQFSKLLKGI